MLVGINIKWKSVSMIQRHTTHIQLFIYFFLLMNIQLFLRQKHAERFVKVVYMYTTKHPTDLI